MGNAVAEGWRALTHNVWTERIQGAKHNVEVWQALLDLNKPYYLIVPVIILNKPYYLIVHGRAVSFQLICASEVLSWEIVIGVKKCCIRVVNGIFSDQQREEEHEIETQVLCR